MASFKLGNYNIDEVLYAVAEDGDGNLVYSLDQLTSASIEVSSESTDYTDKRGNIVRTVYRNKTATFTATAAFLHPLIQNIGSGSDVEEATKNNVLTMPKIITVAPGANITLGDDADMNTVKVIGLFGNGANGKSLLSDTVKCDYKEGCFKKVGKVVTVPSTPSSLDPDEIAYPDSYLITYERTVTSGLKLTNRVDSFPSAVKLILFVSIMDPCSNDLRAAYIEIPTFVADPNMTISLDSESQEIDFNGNINTTYCGSDSKVLYHIYFPAEDKVTTGAAA